MSSIRIKERFYNYTLFTCHAPTETSDEQSMEVYYDLLERSIKACPHLEIIIIPGDFNTKIGKEAINLLIIGKHSLHNVCNDNGHRLINFCASHNLVVGSSQFPLKKIYLGTWTSPHGNKATQIDYFLIRVRHRSNLLDVRTFHGANLDSDHFLTLAKVRARNSIVKTRRGQTCKKFN